LHASNNGAGLAEAESDWGVAAESGGAAERANAIREDKVIRVIAVGPVGALAELVDIAGNATDAGFNGGAGAAYEVFLGGGSGGVVDALHEHLIHCLVIGELGPRKRIVGLLSAC
jgi:hypothetical protein